MSDTTLAAERAAPAGQEPGKPRRRQPLLLIVAVALVLVLIAVVADQTLPTKNPTPGAAVDGTVVTLPKTTLNLSGGSLLQVQVAVQLQDGVGTKKGLPPGETARLENRELLVLSQFTPTKLSTPGGKQASRQALLTSFRQVVGPGRVGPGVMAVYYIDFIMQ